MLAQQALAELQVRGDSHEAGVRLDAAMESDGQSDIDTKLLGEARRREAPGRRAAPG